jgi:uncharacterized protein YhaN
MKLEGAFSSKKEKNEEKKKKLEQLKVVQNEENANLRKADLDLEKQLADFSAADSSLRSVRKGL